MNKYYAGIGSRLTPQNIQELMGEIASILENKDYILRSGHANGADMAFEIGVKDMANMEIYLPYDGFNGGYSNHPSGSYYFIDDDILNPNYEKAYASLIYHPRGFKLSAPSKRMMIRNYFQIYGIDESPKSEFVICWTPNGESVGGTSQAMRLAKKEMIPIYNLAVDFVDHSANDIVDRILSNRNVSSDHCKVVSLFK